MNVGDDELRAACRERLSRYKVPKGVPAGRDLPRNRMGKIDRRGAARARTGKQVLNAAARPELRLLTNGWNGRLMVASPRPHAKEPTDADVTPHVPAWHGARRRLFGRRRGPPVLAADADTIVVSQGSDVLTLDPDARHLADQHQRLPQCVRRADPHRARMARCAPARHILASVGGHQDAGNSPSAPTPSSTMASRSPWRMSSGAISACLGETQSPVRTYISKLKSVEVSGPNKVRFTLSEPFAPFDRQVSLISIVSKRAFEEIGAAKFALAPVGSGPFKVVRWVKDDRVELAAFDGYWAGAPKIKTLIFQPVPSETTRAAALSSGELDVVPILPPALVVR